MNRPDIVAPPTRLRVLQTMQVLGFVRTEGARQLHGLPSPVVAVVVPEVTDSFGAAVTHEVEKAATEATPVVWTL
ncbi:hypothetical protein [Streptomyces sp. NPDC055400]